MKNGRSGQKLRLKIIEALKKNHGFGGSENSDVTIGRIMGIMQIDEVDVEMIPVRVVKGEEG